MKSLIAALIFNLGSAIFNFYTASLSSAVLPAVSLFFGVLGICCAGLMLKLIYDEWIINERRFKW